MRRWSVVLMALAVLCVVSFALAQPDPPSMPGMGMGDDAEAFDVAGMEEEAYAPVAAFASSKKAAPVLTKKAPPMRAVQYTYEAPVTHLESMTVPTQKVRQVPVIEYSKEPVQSKKGAGGGFGGIGSAAGYVGRGLYRTLAPTPHTAQPRAAPPAP